MNKREIKASQPSGSTATPATVEYLFRLYVSVATRASTRAVVNARKICEEHLSGRYRLEVLNLSENVDMAIQDQIVAAPTLVKVTPSPLRRFIGDASNTDRILKSLNFQQAS